METKGIHAALAAIMADVDPIAKGRKNQQQGFQFRGVDDVYNELHPIMAKHGVVCLPECLDRAEVWRKSTQEKDLCHVTVRMKYTLTAADGSGVSGVMAGEAMDSGDKATSKAASIALKYFLFQTFLIPTEADNDPDATTHTPKAANGNGAPRPPAPTVPPPAKPSLLDGAIPVACEKCGAALVDMREKAVAARAAGKKCPDFRCSTATYDPQTKTRGGCDAVVWSVDEWRKRQAVQPQATEQPKDDIPF